VEAFSEVVLLLEEVGEALVRDVEEVDEGLHVARLQQVTANALTTVVFVLLCCRHARKQTFTLLLAVSPRQALVLFGDFIEESGWTGCLGGLLDGLDLLLLLAHLPYAMLTPSFTSAFIGNSKLIAIITPIKLSTAHPTPHPLFRPSLSHSRSNYYCPNEKICKLYIIGNSYTEEPALKRVFLEASHILGFSLLY
jgi:hypothetical protein